MKRLVLASALACAIIAPLAAQVPIGGVLQMPINARFGFAFMNPKAPGILDSVFADSAKVIVVDFTKEGQPRSHLGSGAKQSAELVEYSVGVTGSLDEMGCIDPVPERLVCTMTNKSKSVEIVAHLQNDRVDDAVVIIKRKAS